MFSEVLNAFLWWVCPRLILLLVVCNAVTYDKQQGYWVLAAVLARIFY